MFNDPFTYDLYVPASEDFSGGTSSWYRTRATELYNEYRKENATADHRRVFTLRIGSTPQKGGGVRIACTMRMDRWLLTDESVTDSSVSSMSFVAPASFEDDDIEVHLHTIASLANFFCSSSNANLTRLLLGER